MTPRFPAKAPPARRKRRYNLRLIKATWPYTVPEVAALFGVHKNAVLRWLKDGLPADRGKRPFLIRGDALACFLDTRQNHVHHRCAPHQFYCFRCRAPRAACLGMVDIVIESPTRLRIKALCSVCETAVSKVQRVSELSAIRRRFHVQQLAGEHLLKCTEASLNSDLEK